MARIGLYSVALIVVTAVVAIDATPLLNARGIHRAEVEQWLKDVINSPEGQHKLQELKAYLSKRHLSGLAHYLLEGAHNFDGVDLAHNAVGTASNLEQSAVDVAESVLDKRDIGAHILLHHALKGHLVNKLADHVKDVLEHPIHGVVNAGETLADHAVGTASDLVPTQKRGLGRFLGNIARGGFNLAGNVANTAGNVVGSLANTAVGLGKGVVDTGANLASNLLGTGSNFVQNAAGTAGELGQNAVGAVHSAFYKK